MAKNIKIDQRIIDKLNLVEEFIDDLYFGKEPYKDRIAFIANTLSDVINELKAIVCPVVKVMK